MLAWDSRQPQNMEAISWRSTHQCPAGITDKVIIPMLFESQVHTSRMYPQVFLDNHMYAELLFIDWRKAAVIDFSLPHVPIQLVPQGIEDSWKHLCHTFILRQFICGQLRVLQVWDTKMRPYSYLHTRIEGTPKWQLTSFSDVQRSTLLAWNTCMVHLFSHILMCTKALDPHAFHKVIFLNHNAQIQMLTKVLAYGLKKSSTNAYHLVMYTQVLFVN